MDLEGEEAGPKRRKHPRERDQGNRKGCASPNPVRETRGVHPDRERARRQRTPARRRNSRDGCAYKNSDSSYSSYKNTDGSGA